MLEPEPSLASLTSRVSCSLDDIARLAVECLCRIGRAEVTDAQAEALNTLRGIKVIFEDGREARQKALKMLENLCPPTQ